MSPLSVNHNLKAYGVSRQLSAHYDSLADSVRRLSTGLRVERAADDAAGLAIRELMRADIRALSRARATSMTPSPSSRRRTGPCRSSTRSSSA